MKGEEITKVGSIFSSKLRQIKCFKYLLPSIDELHIKFGEELIIDGVSKPHLGFHHHSRAILDHNTKLLLD